MENLRLACMNGDYLSLKDMLKVGLMFNATLPIDKVYSLLGIVAERGTIHPDHSRTSVKKTKEQIVVEALHNLVKFLEEPKELFGLISGHKQHTTRRVGNLLRSPTVAIKQTYQLVNDMYALLEEVTPGGKAGSLLPIRRPRIYRRRILEDRDCGFESQWTQPASKERIEQQIRWIMGMSQCILSQTPSQLSILN
jgi:hypothetical protein